MVEFMASVRNEQLLNAEKALLCEAFSEVSRLINLVPGCQLDAPLTLHFLSEYKRLLEELGESEVIERGSYE